MSESGICMVRPGMLADCTGALYLEASRTLLIADLHLGYAWAQRRRGELGPLTDGGITERLGRSLDRWKPEHVIFLGDLVHLGKPADAEREAIEGVVANTTARARVTIVLGNHDRNFELDFGYLGLPTTRKWENEEVIAVHGDGDWPASDKLLVMGHLHPAIGIADAVGVVHRLPAFVIGSRAIVMPAYSPFAAGFDLRQALPGEWRRLFGTEPVSLAAITGTQIRLVPRPVTLRYKDAGSGGSG